jgi:DNA-binding GntR family transcriptional regulator
MRKQADTGPGQRPGQRRAAPARHRVKLVLHRGITTGTLPGGTRLVPSHIAAELAVSAHPVRDALRELAAEGFVRLDSSGGAVVHELCRSELEDVYEIRAMLEPVAAARAARSATRASLLPAIELVAAMESETDATRWARFNSSFHSIIDEAGGSPRLAAILKNLRELSALYITHALLSVPGRAEHADAEHEQILRAVIARDPAAAADAALRHLEGTLHALRTVHEIRFPAAAVTPGPGERLIAERGTDRG